MLLAVRQRAASKSCPPKFPSVLSDRGGAIAGMGSGAALGARLQPGGRILPVPLRGHGMVGSPRAPSTTIRNQSKWMDGDLVLGAWRRPGAGCQEETWCFPSCLKRIRHSCRSPGRARCQAPAWEVVSIGVWEAWSGGCLQKVLPEER